MYLDVTDVPHSPDYLEPANYVKFWLAKKMMQHIKRSVIFKRADDSIAEKDYDKILAKHMDVYKNRPYLFFIHMGITEHTPSDGTYDYTNASDWVASGWYKNRYAKEVEQLKKYTNFILDRDPMAVIIYCGDHGAWRLRSSLKTVNDLNKVLNHERVLYKDVVDDRFKIFAAVRLPDEYGKIDESFSPANVFAKVFELIGYNGDKLEIAPNDSFDSGVGFIQGPVMKSGVLVEYTNAK